MTDELIDRIERTAAVALDDRLPWSVRLAAADEVLWWAGPEAVRESLARVLQHQAGCLSLVADNRCICDDLRELEQLARELNSVWPDATDMLFGSEQDGL